MSKTIKTAAATYNAGDRVIVTTAATGHEPLPGTVQATTQTGWVVVLLDSPTDHPTCKDGKVSARAASLRPEASQPVPKAGGIAAQLQAATASLPASKARKPHTAPTVCPDCGCEELEVSKDEEGNTTYACTDDECGWEATFEPGPDHASRMAEALRAARQRYTKDKRPDGAATAHCNDAIARELRDLEPEDVANLADKVLSQPHGYHFRKYGHLNNGQIRMNSGNRIRAAWKQANEDGNTAEIARIASLLGLDIEEETGEE